MSFIMAFNAHSEQATDSEIKPLVKPSPEPAVAKHIKVDEAKLYIECFGQGSPAIIVNAGFGVKVSDGGWQPIIKSLQSTNQICFYDRANIGKSDKSQGHYDLDNIVEQQNGLLKLAGVKAPYLMVGHSYGSYPIKLFNHRYPEKVAGILLIDPSLYGQFQSHINKWDAKNDIYDAETQKKMETQLARWLGEPENIESINMRTSAKLIENSEQFGDKPYVLLWRKNAIWQPPKEMPKSWHPAVWQRIKKSYVVDVDTMQNLSSKTKITFANTTEHFVHKYEPEIVINEIQYLLREISK